MLIFRFGLRVVNYFAMAWMPVKKETIVHDDGCSIYKKGQNIEFHFVKPDELPAGYLDEICLMVEAGGSVATKWVRYNLERAFLIGYV